jgi:hypothetical protein
LEFLDAAQVDYIVGMAENKVVTRRAKRVMGANVFGETR